MAVAQEAFERCWHEHARRVTAYAERHVGREASLDVLSATFLTAWRTCRNVPDDPLPWLISVARGHVRNHVRSTRRQATLAERLRLLDDVAHFGDDVGVSVAARAEAIGALAQLPEQDREALLLVAWDGLSQADAARVAGCRAPAFRVRLHRARRRLEELVGSMKQEGTLA